MGQQESSYKKLDEKARRRRREKRDKKDSVKEQVEQEKETITTTTTTSSSLLVEKEKTKAGGHFSLPGLRWRPSLGLGSLNNNPSETDLASSPGWYHGWCSKSQVTGKLHSLTEINTYQVRN